MSDTITIDDIAGISIGSPVGVKVLIQEQQFWLQQQTETLFGDTGDPVCRGMLKMLLMVVSIGFAVLSAPDVSGAVILPGTLAGVIYQGNRQFRNFPSQRWNVYC